MKRVSNFKRVSIRRVCNDDTSVERGAHWSRGAAPLLGWLYSALIQDSTTSATRSDQQIRESLLLLGIWGPFHCHLGLWLPEINRAEAFEAMLHSRALPVRIGWFHNVPFSNVPSIQPTVQIHDILDYSSREQSH